MEGGLVFLAGVAIGAALVAIPSLRDRPRGHQMDALPLPPMVTPPAITSRVPPTGSQAQINVTQIAINNNQLKINAELLRRIEALEQPNMKAGGHDFAKDDLAAWRKKHIG